MKRQGSDKKEGAAEVTTESVVAEAGESRAEVGVLEGAGVENVQSVAGVSAGNVPGALAVVHLENKEIESEKGGLFRNA